VNNFNAVFLLAPVTRQAALMPKPHHFLLTRVSSLGINNLPKALSAQIAQRLATLCASGQSAQGTKYKEIYVHSKLLLVDDVFFTLGSANVNVRSMEGDSELNIACPSPGLTQQWRKHLWRLHTGKTPEDEIAREFKMWRDVMDRNGSDKKAGEPMSTPLLEFFDGESSMFAPD
jgi:phosphatidylserine/phosphatidylglycerophosphate/cardiolipin synthase-like enzyme